MVVCMLARRGSNIGLINVYNTTKGKLCHSLWQNVRQMGGGQTTPSAQTTSPSRRQRTARRSDRGRASAPLRALEIGVKAGG